MHRQHWDKIVTVHEQGEETWASNVWRGDEWRLRRSFMTQKSQDVVSVYKLKRMRRGHSDIKRVWYYSLRKESQFSVCFFWGEGT